MKLWSPVVLRCSLAIVVAGALISLAGCGGGGGGGTSAAGTSIAPLPSNAQNTGPASAPVTSGAGTVTVPAGAVPASTSVTIAAINSASFQGDFAMTAAPFSPFTVRSYIIQVSVGPVAPSAGIPVVLNVPPAVVASLSGTAAQAFVQMMESGGDNVLDNFELLPSVYSSASPATVSLTLPIGAFTNSRDNSGNYEANIVIAGATDTTSSSIAVPAVADACLGSAIGSPLQGVPVSGLAALLTKGAFSGAFNPPTNNGIDLFASLGTPVISVADGTVVDVCYQITETSKNKYNERCGWGFHVVIENGDGTKTVYAHLEKGSITVKNGDKVTKGEVLGLVGVTGGVTYPHLHLEYVVHQVKVDPFPCFQ